MKESLVLGKLILKECTKTPKSQGNQRRKDQTRVFSTVHAGGHKGPHQQRLHLIIQKLLIDSRPRVVVKAKSSQEAEEGGLQV